MDMLQALAGRTSQAEVFTVEGEATQVTFEANVMKSAETRQTQGVALRASVDGHLGFTAAGGEPDEARLIANLLAAAPYADAVPLVFPGPATASEVLTFDPALFEAPLTGLVETGREIVEVLRGIDQDAKISANLERRVGAFGLRNSAGQSIAERTSAYTVSIGVERVRGDDILMLFDGTSDIGLTDTYRTALARLSQLMTLAKRSASLSSGRMPVLFAPGAAMLLLLPILMGTNGQSILRRTSPLVDKLGTTLFDDKLTVWDDPTLSGRPGSSRYDGEGVPCTRKALIERGVCASFVHDLKTAALLGTRSTGNGRRGLFSAPSPAPYNVVLEAGSRPWSEMLAGMSHGLFVIVPLGMGQGNVISGAFSNTLGLAFAVERGEIVGRVKDVSIAGNIYQDLRHISALSQESVWVNGTYRLPYILLPELNVVCKEG